MEENVAENPKRTPASDGEGCAAPDLGKFKSVDALLSAYGELEAEFTRRSQRLRALEEKYEPQPEPEQTGDLSGNKSGARDGEELYRAVSENEEVRARVLSDYLRTLRGVPLMTGAGTGIVSPPNRPKTLSEAGKLALGYLKNGRK